MQLKGGVIARAASEGTGETVDSLDHFGNGHALFSHQRLFNQPHRRWTQDQASLLSRNHVDTIGPILNLPALPSYSTL